MSTPDDWIDLKKLALLDPQEIGAAYDRYFSEIYRYALYRTGDEHAAEDIASEVFVRLLESAQKRRAPHANLKGWLIRTAAHIIADRFRVRYRKPEVPLPASLVDPKMDPVSRADSREQIRVLRDAYAKLTPDQQHVIALRFGQGYSIEETASFMNRNVNAVKALQFRALAALQRELGEVNDES